MVRSQVAVIKLETKFYNHNEKINQKEVAKFEVDRADN